MLSFNDFFLWKCMNAIENAHLQLQIFLQTSQLCVFIILLIKLNYFCKHQKTHQKLQQRYSKAQSIKGFNLHGDWSAYSRVVQYLLTLRIRIISFFKDKNYILWIFILYRRSVSPRLKMTIRIPSVIQILIFAEKISTILEKL